MTHPARPTRDRARIRALTAGSLLLALIGASPAGAEDARGVAWNLFHTPSPGVPQAIGGYAHGCLAGGIPLALDGVGYQVMRPARQRYYGHPVLLDYLQKLGRRVHEAGLPLLNLGDLSQPRGGPMNTGHASHQIGLDVDIWLRLDLPLLPRDRRDTLHEISLVNGDTHRVKRPGWTQAQAKLLRLAVADPRVDRIFVNPAIKHELCRTSGPDHSWLRRIRPWYGHDDHFHVRLACPADSPLCETQKPVPDGDGCGEELSSWMSEAHPPKPQPPGYRPERAAPELPEACYRVTLAAGITSTLSR